MKINPTRVIFMLLLLAIFIGSLLLCVLVVRDASSNKSAGESIISEKINKFGKIVIRDGKVDCNSLVVENNASSLRFYIRIDSDYYQMPSSHANDIFGILECFEYNNPNIKIKSWMIEKTQQAQSTPAKVHGLWLDCEKKSN